MNAPEKSLFSLCELLIVDGNERARRSLATALSKHGYKVGACTCAAEALLAIQHYCPKYVVTELKLPDESGLNLISQLKQILPAATVVVLTAYASVATAVEAIKRGAANYLIKPAGAAQIIAALSSRDGKRGEIPLAEKALSVERLEWEYINWVLLENNGNLSGAARTLSMHRRTLQRKLQKRPHRR